MSGAERIRILQPTGELLPAEERLQNVLKSITDRITEEKAILDHLTRGGCSMEVYEQRVSFIQGLDIAWSLAKTESLRRQTPDTQN